MFLNRCLPFNFLFSLLLYWDFLPFCYYGSQKACPCPKPWRFSFVRKEVLSCLEMDLSNASVVVNIRPWSCMSIVFHILYICSLLLGRLNVLEIIDGNCFPWLGWPFGPDNSWWQPVCGESHSGLTLRSSKDYLKALTGWPSPSLPQFKELLGDYSLLMAGLWSAVWCQSLLSCRLLGSLSLRRFWCLFVAKKMPIIERCQSLFWCHKRRC